MSEGAIGGAARAGCVAFSFVGLLLGVGLVVWLGSQVRGGDDGGDAAPEVSLDPDGLGLDEVVPTEVTGTSVAVADDGTLDDGESVFVDGTGFAPGPVELTTCLTHQARIAGGLAGCDPDTAATVEVGADGILDAGYAVRRVITVIGTDYDCAAVDGGCSLVAAPPGSPDLGPAAALRFATGLAPVDAEPPPEG